MTSERYEATHEVIGTTANGGPAPHVVEEKVVRRDFTEPAPEVIIPGAGPVEYVTERVTVERDLPAHLAVTADPGGHFAVGEHAVSERTVRPAAGFVRAWDAWIAFGLVLALATLGLRLAFLLTGANPANGFVDLVYDLTGPFVAPFEGIGSDRPLDNGGFLEVAALVAMVVYALGALVVAMLVRLLASFLPERRTVIHRSHYVSED
jgi:hypothetical protein